MKSTVSEFNPKVGELIDNLKLHEQKTWLAVLEAIDDVALGNIDTVEFEYILREWGNAHAAEQSIRAVERALDSVRRSLQ